MRIALLNILARLRRDEKGASLVEYAVALLVVAAVGVTTFTTMGGQVAANATAACNVLTAEGGADAGCAAP